RAEQAAAFDFFVEPVHAEEEVCPAEETLPGPAERQWCLGRLEEQLTDAQLLRQLPLWPIGRKDTEWDDDGARPARHRVDVEIEPARQQHHLRRDRGAVVVRKLSQKRQIEFREAIASGRAA